MKYGILTFHNIPNIGALLQAQALCVAIRNLGIDCDLIDYTCDNIKKRELVRLDSSNVFYSLIDSLFFWPKMKRKIILCQKYMRNLDLYSAKEYLKNDLILLNEDYDAFISGSDMIWNLEVTGADKSFMCDFASPDKPRFSYGSSIGAKWKSSDLEDVISLLSQYDAIAVREQDTCDIIQSFGLKSVLVADPTMLLSKEYWQGIAIDTKYSNYVLVYFPSKEIVHAAQVYAKRHGYKVLVIDNGFPRMGYKQVFPLDPKEWLSLFLTANAVFTNSYHGLLFSLYFNKPVWTANYGNRIISLLNKFGLNNILLQNDKKLCYEIDYANVNKKIESFRNDSLNYLYSILKK